MTNLRTGKVVRRTESRVHDGGKDRPVIVTIYPKTIGFRTLGTRQEYKLSIAKCLELAIIAEIESKKRAKKNTKRVSAL